jgi:hypothetical protein
MEIPDRTFVRLRESKVAYDRWAALVRSGKNVWTKEQEEQLRWFYEMLAATHDALSNFIDANAPK